MATIAENIQTLRSIKSDIKNAIIQKGGSVTDAFGTYAQAITDLPSGGGGNEDLINLIERDGTSLTIPDGTTKKGIGNIIRDWSLDEFPQFINVLKGDMSVVGTRPPTVDEWEKYELHHRVRLAMKPGVTGMWQVSGRSNITDFEEVVKLDTQYISQWNLGLDIKIIFKTVAVVLKKEGSM